jgi:transketolase
MINQNQKLNPKIFDKDVEKIATRTGFGEGLVLAGEKNDDVVALCADLTESVQMHLFRDKFPERFFEMGVAEQNMAAVASGMAAMGKIPFVGSYAIFNPGRNWEQIRTTICWNNRPVIIVGSHAGVSASADGGSHQALEDIALMRVLPRMIVVSPCDAVEAKKAAMSAEELNQPCYLRLARNPTPIITTDDTPFEIGKAKIFYGSENEKSDVGIIATGPLLHKALLAAEILKKEKISATVLNMTTIKPLDEKAVIALAKNTGAIVTVEEHQIAGGLGSVVAECFAQNLPTPVEFVGVRDQFGQSGTPEELLKHYGLDETGIIAAVKKVLARKIKL